MLKLQRAAVLADGADRALVKPLRPPGADLQRHLNLASNLTGEPLDDLLDDQRRILVHPPRANLNPAIVLREHWLAWHTRTRLFAIRATETGGGAAGERLLRGLPHHTCGGRAAQDHHGLRGGAAGDGPWGARGVGEHRA